MGVRFPHIASIDMASTAVLWKVPSRGFSVYRLDTSSRAMAPNGRPVMGWK